MKRFAIVLAASVFALSLSGCAGCSQSTSSAPSSTESSASSSSDASATDGSSSSTTDGSSANQALQEALENPMVSDAPISKPPIKCDKEESLGGVIFTFPEKWQVDTGTMDYMISVNCDDRLFGTFQNTGADTGLSAKSSDKELNEYIDNAIEQAKLGGLYVIGDPKLERRDDMAYAIIPFVVGNEDPSDGASVLRGYSMCLFAGGIITADFSGIDVTEDELNTARWILQHAKLA